MRLFMYLLLTDVNDFFCRRNTAIARNRLNTVNYPRISTALARKNPMIKPKKIRVIFMVLTLFACFWGGFGCKNSKAPNPGVAAVTPEPTGFRLGAVRGDLDALAIHAAADQGFFAALGLARKDLQLYENETQLLGALGEGRLDTVCVGLDAVMLAVARDKLPAVVVAQAVAGSPALVIRNQEVATPFELVGMAVAVPSGASAEAFFLNAFLVANKLDGRVYIDEKVPVEMESEMVSTRTIVGFAAGEPTVSLAIGKQNAGIMAQASDVSVKVPGAGIIASSALLKDHPDRQKILVDTIRRGVEWIRAHPDQAAALGATITGLDPKVVGAALSRMDFSAKIDLPACVDYAQYLNEKGYAKIENPDRFVRSLFPATNPPHK